MQLLEILQEGGRVGEGATPPKIVWGPKMLAAPNSAHMARVESKSQKFSEIQNSSSNNFLNELKKIRKIER